MLETRIHQHNSAGLASGEDELIYNENEKMPACVPQKWILLLL